MKAPVEDVAETVRGLLRDFIAATAPERRAVALVAIELGIDSTLITCDRCHVTAPIPGIARHINVTEADYLALAVEVDGPNAGMHTFSDLRMAGDLERLEYDHTVRTR